MKTRYATLFTTLLFGALVAQAQTLDNSSTSPQVGESYTNYSAPYVAPGPGGANQTWNHASLPMGTSQVTTYQTPASTGHGGSFPGANLATSAGGGSFGFFQSSSAGLDVLGVYSASINSYVVYSDPERILSYPCSYNSSWVDNLSANFVSGGFPVVRAGTVSGQADGYGTLVMPYGSVANVLRVRTIEDYDDDVDGLYTIEYDFTNHYYYKPGTHAPLMVTYDQVTTLLGTPSTSQSAVWLAGGPTGILEALRNDIGMDIYPNPATDQATIVLSSSGGSLQLEVLDAMGKLVLSEGHNGMAMGIARIDLDVTALPAGLYQVRLTNTNGEQGTQRLIVQ